MSVLLAAAPRINVGPHAEVGAMVLYAMTAIVVAFFVVRWDLWKRLWFTRVDPRPAGLLRIAFGIVVLWTFVDLIPLARVLFTDEGLFHTDLARNNYGGKLKVLWDPEHGFENVGMVFHALWSKGSVLHLRSDPGFVAVVYGATLLSTTAMVLGWRTRITTILTWVLVEQLYRYSPIFYTGGDTVTRVFLFLGMFTRWGEAYSIDGWRRTRAGILAGVMPPLRKIAAWPLRLMMLQLTIIYCATGVLKSGITWADGTALYYALNLDHFYRVPTMGLITWLQYLWILPTMTVAVHWWEMLFPLCAIGMAVNAFERERRLGLWPVVARWKRVLTWVLVLGFWALGAHLAGISARYYLLPRYLPFRVTPDQIQAAITAGTWLVFVLALSLHFGLRRFKPQWFDNYRLWFLGKRSWLVVGVLMHIGIDVSMNVGTFAQVMMAVYFAWLSGDEVERGFRFLMKGSKSRVVKYAGDPASVQKAALVRPFDLGQVVRFRRDETLAPGQIALEVGPDLRLLEPDPRIYAHLVPVFPSWLLRPLLWIPGCAPLVGRVLARAFR